MYNNIEKQDIIEKLKQVKDPEIEIDIWTLGLIYKITPEEDGVEILMTLTTPFCPFADDIIALVEKKVGELGYEEGDVRVELTFEPLWSPSKEVRMLLGV
ncbi:MAG: metal-sulfur cluster assembly factor [Patescibacteria group bacterium]